MEFLDPRVQDTLSNITVIALLATFIIVGTLALVRQWIVIGWTYKEKEKQVEKLEERIKMMETLAWRGTTMARQGIETAEHLAYKERNNNEPH